DETTLRLWINGDEPYENEPLKNDYWTQVGISHYPEI
ncbi:hypothetical protein TNCT_730891, partial [Trichonephila clavata]